jgi:hypothetical protein
MTALPLYTTAFPRTSVQLGEPRTKKPLTYAEARAHGRAVKKSAIEAMNNEIGRRQRDARTARLARQENRYVTSLDRVALTENEVAMRRAALAASTVAATPVRRGRRSTRTTSRASAAQRTPR